MQKPRRTTSLEIRKKKKIELSNSYFVSFFLEIADVPYLLALTVRTQKHKTKKKKTPFRHFSHSFELFESSNEKKLKIKALPSI